MVDDSAPSVGTAGRYLARVETLVAETGFVCVAIFICSATQGAHVVETNVSEETVIVESTSEQTVSVDAFFIEGTLVVARADWKTHIFATGVSFVAVV